MTKFLSTAAALALVALAGVATAQTMAAPAPTEADAAPGPVKAGGYRGVDFNGRPVDVQAPYGGRSQSQADAKEAPMTKQLNDAALRDATPSH